MRYRFRLTSVSFSIVSSRDIVLITPTAVSRLLAERGLNLEPTSSGKVKYFDGILPVSHGRAGDCDTLEDHLGWKCIANWFWLSRGHSNANQSPAETKHLTFEISTLHEIDYEIFRKLKSLST